MSWVIDIGGMPPPLETASPVLWKEARGSRSQLAELCLTWCVFGTLGKGVDTVYISLWEGILVIGVLPRVGKITLEHLPQGPLEIL